MKRLGEDVSEQPECVLKAGLLAIKAILIGLSTMMPAHWTTMRRVKEVLRRTDPDGARLGTTPEPPMASQGSMSVDIRRPDVVRVTRVDGRRAATYPRRSIAFVVPMPSRNDSYAFVLSSRPVCIG